ncbi:ctl-like protein [Anaeramoeba flamelloides]|uniref:Choline transporter-like protein n=1 Tax=Anaeramoeba flamelloides TaxID=1746091 RepID=A0AAV7YLU9_9EUKA|nr:ctl-like protein [Anaeramoeba flamelloides]KAJ6247466.1 ctl-like protein [Anaeramoeba flamelloides]
MSNEALLSDEEHKVVSGKNIHEMDVHEKFEYDESFSGPLSQRKHRDVFWLILFILFWIGMIVVAGLAYSTGTPKRLMYPKDYRGNVCGMDNTQAKEALGSNYTKTELSFLSDTSDLKYVFWPHDGSSEEICVDECPSKGDIANPLCDKSIKNYLDGDDPYCPYKTESILRRCLPTQLTNTNSSDVINKVKKSVSGSSGLSKVMGDLIQGWYVLLVSIFIAVALSFLWLIVIRKFARFMVFFTIFFYFAMLGLVTWYFWHQAEESDNIADDKKMDTDTTNAKVFRIFFYIMFAVIVLSLFALIFLRKKILLAIAVIKEASKAVSDIPMVVFFPLVSFGMLLVLYLWWVPVSMFLMSSGKPRLVTEIPATGDPYLVLDYKNEKSINYLGIYHFFGLLWTNAFIVALTQGTIAGAIASWYWTRDKNNIPGSPVKESFVRNCKYHLGSYAFGSLIIAIIQLLRVMLEYLERSMKKGNQENKFIKYLFYAMRCCLKCMESTMKFINRNAYIMIAVYGQSFCKSTKRAFHLIGRNLFRIMAINIVGDFLLFLGKLSVCILTGIIAMAMCKADDNMSLYVIPSVLSAILAYLVASGFMAVFEMAIDTILLSFCEDCERHDGSSVEKEPYASEELQEFMTNIEDNKHKSKKKHKKSSSDNEEEKSQLSGAGSGSGSD